MRSLGSFGSASALFVGLGIGVISVGACTNACNSYTADGALVADPTLPEAPQPPAAATPPGEVPKAPPVVGAAPPEDELTEKFGVFVSARGTADGTGTRDRPLASIQAGIDLGKKVGKRVYVCTGTYRESITLADSISVLGALDCEDAKNWKLNAPRARVDAPASPAVRARDIASPTLVDGFEIIAASAALSSGSSFGLIAERAGALTIARSKITAGDGADGENGVDPAKLVLGANANGGPAVRDVVCTPTTCARVIISNVGRPLEYDWTLPERASGGVGTCIGAPNKDGEPGGYGGSGSLYTKVGAVMPYKSAAEPLTPQAFEGGGPGTGAAGDAGTNGKNGVEGVLSPDGYVPADGKRGTDGFPGHGGHGGSGSNPMLAPPGDHQVSHGYTGAGGGAGGCPGLAGSPGKGGGASVVALLYESPMTFDAVELVAGRGGKAGAGTFGSEPTAGGEAGPNGLAGWYPSSTGQPGGAGGLAGTSGNGAAGPSIGLAYAGARPALVNGARAIAGTGGAGIDERHSPQGTRKIDATAAGQSKEILAL